VSGGARLGTGVAVGFSSPVTGRAQYVAGVESVLALMSEDVSGMILIVREAGATGVAPIIGDAGGVVCLTGGPTSHLALVAKEYGVPALMGAELSGDPAALDGTAITLNPDGSITAGSGD